MRGETLLERAAIRLVEADELGEPRDRVVDDRVRRDHHVARRRESAARVSEQHGRGAERVRDDRVQRADRSRDIGDRIGEIREIELVIGRIAVPGRVDPSECPSV